MRGRERFARVEPILAGVSKPLGRLPLSARSRVLVALRGTRGNIGMGLRYAALHSLASHAGPNVSVREGVYLLGASGLHIGENVSIHPMCYIDATGGLTIGDNVSIAHGTTIMSTTHAFDDPDVPINEQGVTALPTTIGQDVWIGAQVVVVAGVAIGSGCVIAANSVVTHDIPSGSVAAGSPARVIRTRGQS